MNVTEPWDRLMDADWEEITLRLLMYVQRKVRRLYWRTGSVDFLAEGMTPEDIVYEAIQRVFSGAHGQLAGTSRKRGERRWSQEKDLLPYLYDVVDSLVSNLVTSWDNQNLASLPESDSLERFDEEKRGVLPASKDRDEQFVLALIDEIGADEDLTRIFDAMWEGYHKASQIAAVTGLEIKVVYRCKHKLRKIAERVRERSSR